MDPVIFSIGKISIRWYSVCILTGIIIAYFLIQKEAKKKNIDKEFVFNLVFWVVIFGIIGARLYYVLFSLKEYNHFIDMFKVWEGGLAIHGGILAGLITLIIYCNKNKVKKLVMTDIAVPGIIIAQAIGRWGNFFNGEAFGKAVTDTYLRSLHFIPNFIIKNMYLYDSYDGEWAYRHPCFYYESLWCLLGFIILLVIRKFYKERKDGFLTAFYMMWYGLGRFFIEFLRTDALKVFNTNIRIAQVVSFLLFSIGLGMMIYLLIKQLKEKK
jgi:phosphatidylglycerol:prolipoprotein diacylglycerol transferase